MASTKKKNTGMKDSKYPHLDKSDFVFPNQRKYPINTKKRARAALSYGSRYLSKQDYQKVKRAVARKYPSIHVSGTKIDDRKRKKKK